jgi:hypothetical protein
MIVPKVTLQCMHYTYIEWTAYVLYITLLMDQTMEIN